jgi:hypothetical protein
MSSTIAVLNWASCRPALFAVERHVGAIVKWSGFPLDQLCTPLTVSR